MIAVGKKRGLHSPLRGGEVSEEHCNRRAHQLFMYAASDELSDSHLHSDGGLPLYAVPLDTPK